MSRGAKSLGGFICSACLRCPAHEPAASRPEWLSVAKKIFLTYGLA